MQRVVFGPSIVSFVPTMESDAIKINRVRCKKSGVIESVVFDPSIMALAPTGASDVTRSAIVLHEMHNRVIS